MSFLMLLQTPLKFWQMCKNSPVKISGTLQFFIRHVNNAGGKWNCLWRLILRLTGRQGRCEYRHSQPYTPPPWVAHFLQAASLSRPHASNHRVTDCCHILQMLLMGYRHNHGMEIRFITLFKGQQLVTQWATSLYFRCRNVGGLKATYDNKQQRVCHFYLHDDLMRHNSVKAWHR